MIINRTWVDYNHRVSTRNLIRQMGVFYQEMQPAYEGQQVNDITVARLRCRI